MQIIIDQRLIWKTVKYTDIFADHNHSIGLTSVLVSMCKYQNPDFFRNANAIRIAHEMCYFSTFTTKRKKMLIFCISPKVMEVSQHNNLVKG